MHNILVNQNKPENILRLAAQRQLYKEAKWFFKMQIFLTVPITIVLSLLRLIPESVFGFSLVSVTAFLSVVVALGDLIVDFFYVSDLKTKAAKVQEDFDCSVYEMPRNEVFCKKNIPAESVKKFSRKYVPNPKSPLEDWYPVEIRNYPKEKAIFVCQKTNLHYDRTLRSKFIRDSLLVATSILALIVTCALIVNPSTAGFFTLFIAPALPILVLALKILFSHLKAIRASNELHEIINSLNEKNSGITMNELRDVQNRIFCIRKDGPLVPEEFYNKKRKKLEEEMHANAVE